MTFFDCEHDVSEWTDTVDEYGNIVHTGLCQQCGVTVKRMTFTEEGNARLGAEILRRDMEFLFRDLDE